MKPTTLFLRVTVDNGVPVGAPEVVTMRCLDCRLIDKCDMAAQLQAYDADQSLEALVVSCGSFLPRIEGNPQS